MTLRHKMTFEGTPVFQFWPKGLLRTEPGDRRDGPVFPDLDLDALNVDELAEVVEFFSMVTTRAEEMRQSKLIRRADDLTANVAEEAGRPLPSVPLPEPEPVADEQPSSTVPEGSPGSDWSGASVSITDPSGGGTWRGHVT